MFLRQELSRVRAAALTERGQAEEELMKVRNQARLEEVRPDLSVEAVGTSARPLLLSWGTMSNSPFWVSMACK